MNRNNTRLPTPHPALSTLFLIIFLRVHPGVNRTLSSRQRSRDRGVARQAKRTAGAITADFSNSPLPSFRTDQPKTPETPAFFMCRILQPQPPPSCSEYRIFDFCILNCSFLVTIRTFLFSLCYAPFISE